MDPSDIYGRSLRYILAKALREIGGVIRENLDIMRCPGNRNVCESTVYQLRVHFCVHIDQHVL